MIFFSSFHVSKIDDSTQTQLNLTVIQTSAIGMYLANLLAGSTHCIQLLNNKQHRAELSKARLNLDQIMHCQTQLG